MTDRHCTKLYAIYRKINKHGCNLLQINKIGYHLLQLNKIGCNLLTRTTNLYGTIRLPVE